MGGPHGPGGADAKVTQRALMLSPHLSSLLVKNLNLVIVKSLKESEK